MPFFDNYVPSANFGNSGSVLNQLGGGIPHADWVRLRQPWVDDRGRACVTLRDVDGGYTKNDSHGGEAKPLLRNYLCNELRNRGFNLPMVTNAATLRKEQWIELDKQILLAARQELVAAADLEAANSFSVAGMSRMTLEYQAMSDPGMAYVDMDGTTEGTTDTPLFILRSLPLPITHSDFGFSDRELQVSRSGGSGLDVVMGEAAGRRVAESWEDQVIGNVTGVTYATQTAGAGAHTGTSTVYGYRNFPQRLTKLNFTAPTASGWTPELTYNEFLEVVASLLNTNYSKGPYRCYYSTDWFQYMNRVFSVSGGNNPGETLRSMLLKIPELQDVTYLPRLTQTFTFLIVAMRSEVAQMVVGMDVSTIQWQEKGGLELRFKVLGIKVPRLRSDYNSRTGILHGVTSAGNL